MTGGQYKRLRLLQNNAEKATTLETAALEAGRGRKQRRSLQIVPCLIHKGVTKMCASLRASLRRILSRIGPPGAVAGTRLLVAPASARARSLFGFQQAAPAIDHVAMTRAARSPASARLQGRFVEHVSARCVRRSVSSMDRTDCQSHCNDKVPAPSCRRARSIGSFYSSDMGKIRDICGKTLTPCS